MLLFMHSDVSSLKRNPVQAGEDCCRGLNCSNSANDKLVLNVLSFTTSSPRADYLSGYVTSGEVVLHLQDKIQPHKLEFTNTCTNCNV